MRPRRFDTQLQFVFMVLSGLTILVGLASVGVNRFLTVTQQQVLRDSIAVIERAERVGVQADLAQTLAAQLATGDSEPEINGHALALGSSINRIAQDLAAMRQFLGADSVSEAPAAEAQALVTRMAQAVRAGLSLDAGLRQNRAALAEAGVRLTELVGDEIALARLRITAGISQLYRAAPEADPRPALDRLADADFFAFERLGELQQAVARLSAASQAVPDAADHAALQALRAEYEDALQIAEARLVYMPSGAAVSRAAADLALFAAAAQPHRLLDQRGARLDATEGLAAIASDLDAILATLTAEAAQGRDRTRAGMQAGVAAAGQRVLLMSAALVGLTLIAVAVGGLVWLRARRMVVLRLRAVTQRMVGVARGNMGQPMTISGQDEIGRLEKALNVLRRRTEDAARLRGRLEAEVLARTADVVAEMQSANAARAEAEELSRGKTHFMARMSHEIRTPLNGVIGMLDLLAGDELDPARRARLETALTSARDLQDMTEDILAFSSGEEAATPERRVAFDPARLARDLAEHLQVLAHSKGLEGQTQIAANLPPVLIGDPARIRQVMVNLISNAIKYTDAGVARLTVAHHALPDGRHEVSLAVSDTGPGMSGDEMRQAFDIYGRTVDARRRGLPGVGLGLAIVRQLTDAMGGELRVTTAPGQGSRFTLVLRLDVGTPQDLPGSAAPTATPHGRRVLVVDDHPVNRLVARGYLERLGADVTEAATGAEALAAAAEGRFDAILIDLDLPDLRGEELAARLPRKGARTAILTADLVVDDAASRARYGVDHLLTKPVSPRALAMMLEGQPSAAPTPDPDSDVLAALQSDLDDLGAEAATAIVAAFLADLRTDLQRLHTAEPDARRKLAHRMKGAASNFDLTPFCAAMQRLQDGDDSALAQVDAAAAVAEKSLRLAATRLGLQLPEDAAKQ